MEGPHQQHIPYSTEYTHHHGEGTVRSVRPTLAILYYVVRLRSSFVIHLGTNQLSIYGKITNICIEEFPPLPCVAKDLGSSNQTPRSVKTPKTIRS